MRKLSRAEAILLVLALLSLLLDAVLFFQIRGQGPRIDSLEGDISKVRRTVKLLAVDYDVPRLDKEIAELKEKLSQTDTFPPPMSSAKLNQLVTEAAGRSGARVASVSLSAPRTVVVGKGEYRLLTASLSLSGEAAQLLAFVTLLEQTVPATHRLENIRFFSEAKAKGWSANLDISVISQWQ